jgi:hypothetical protein
MAVVFGRSIPVTITWNHGSPDEQRRDALIGGNLRDTVLVQPDDHPVTGEVLTSPAFFDEPRVITAVHPVTSLGGSISYWEALIIPLSQWQRENRRQTSHTINVTGQGNKVNVDSVDQSVQVSISGPPERVAVERALEEIRSAVRSIADAGQRQDAEADVEMIRLELQRRQPDRSRIWGFLGNLNVVSAIAERATKLGQAIEGYLNLIP